MPPAAPSSPRDEADGTASSAPAGDPRLPVSATDPALLATFQAVFGQSPIGAGIFDRECRYVRVNEALQRIIGLPAEQLIGRRVEDVLVPLGARVAANLRAAMANGTPLANQEFVGATFAHGGEPRAFLASYFRLADENGQLIGAASLVNDVTEAHRTRDELRVANERLALLSRISGALASCLDMDDALTAFAELVVPDFADHCVVDLFDDETRLLRRVAVVHDEGSVPAQEPWLAAEDYPPDHPAIEAMRSRRAVLDPGGEAVAAGIDAAVGAEPRSTMTAPLVARGDVLGAVTFATSRSGRTFSDADRDLVEELASRVATALDNARLYAREQRIALMLQRSLLPHRLPETPTLEVAAVYHPAAHDGSVGGDWYDVIPLSCGRVALVMGDVMGRGVAAAALMGQLRAAVRAYAAQDLSPAVLLRHLDELVHGLGDDTLVTCVYAVYDPVEEALCVANAGHLPPVVVHDGQATLLDDHGVLLGAGHGEHPQHEVPFPAGAVLALYTDGLVERRSRDIDGGIGDLTARLVAAGGSLEGMCADVVAAFEGGEGDADDVAVMLVRPDPSNRPRVERLDVVPHAARVRDIRHFATETLLAWGEPTSVTEPIELLVTELVTNVVRHASGHAAIVRLERHADRIVIAVVDLDAAPPRLAHAAPDDEGGRGLHLVEAVADRWGVRPLPTGGKVVWCELLVPSCG